MKPRDQVLRAFYAGDTTIAQVSERLGWLAQQVSGANQLNVHVGWVELTSSHDRGRGVTYAITEIGRARVEAQDAVLRTKEAVH